PAPDPVQPARAPEPPPVWARVRAIRRHLEERTWQADVAQALAEEWAISLDLVQRHAAEASRQLEAVLDDRRGAATIAADLEAALQLAFEQGDPYAVRGLLAEKLKLHGIGAHRDSRNDPKPQQPATAGLSKFLRPEKPS
ncbi:MAG: hypothetical protein MUF64_32290, partial [Polyangiaceae bacterium]|nr:hypothetical protein [Polyangiaceae bacterium]